MKSNSRITSILSAALLASSITGSKSFNLSSLKLLDDLDFQLPTNLRLGHFAEKIVAEAIKASENYELLHENIQIIEDKRTIGELDFIIEEIETKQIIHLELGYKFYLYDPSISDESIHNWVGPNRNDALNYKLNKLKEKQFPLLYHPITKSLLKDIDVKKVEQKLCLLASLYLPYEFDEILNPECKKAVKGYYLNLETFVQLNNSSKTYFIPPKTSWGINPKDNETWLDFETVLKDIKKSLSEKQSLLCWIKQGDSYKEFFIVWW